MLDRVLSENSGAFPGLLRGAVVVVQHAAQPLALADGTRGRWPPERLNQFVAEALVVPLDVIMRHELRQGTPEVALAEHDQTVEAFLFDGPHEPCPR